MSKIKAKSLDLSKELVLNAANGIVNQVTDSDDFTYYMPLADWSAIAVGNRNAGSISKTLGDPTTEPEWPGYEGPVAIFHWQSDDQSDSNELPYPDSIPLVRGRGIVVKCYEGRFIAVTVRSQKRDRANAKQFTSSVSEFPKSENPSSRSWPKYAFDLNSVSARITDLVHIDKGHPLDGLIVVAGTTGCGKSTVIRNMLKRYFRNLAGGGRESAGALNHLLTIEDPIEDYIFGATPSEAVNNHGVFYTPQSLIKTRNSPDPPTAFLPGDVSNVEIALDQALRQTPQAVYVGELRRPDDWPHILRFAGTGHFCVTTTHAGSLYETFKLIFSAAKAKTRAEQGEIASRILAVVHLQNQRIAIDDDWLMKKTRTNAPSAIQVGLPAVWTRSHRSVAGIIADGIASVVPARMDQQRTSCIASCSMVSQIMDMSIFSGFIRKTSLSELKARIVLAATMKDLMSI